MAIVIEIVLPVFGILLLGYAAARTGFFDETGIRGLSLFVFNFAIPILLFRTLAGADIPADIPWGFLASYYLGALAVFGLGMFVAGTVFSRRRDEQGLLGFSAAFSNTVLLGIPVVLTTFGETAALPLFMLLAFHGMLLFTAVTMAIEIGRGQGKGLGHLPWLTLKGLGRNPIILGLATGLGFNLLDLPIPAPLDSVAQSLGSAATPCALFAMGATLSQYRISGSLLLLKTLAHPLIVWLLARFVFEVSPLWTAVAVIMAAQPTGINAYLFAQRYGICLATATTTVFLSTAFSIISLSVLLFLLEVR